MLAPKVSDSAGIKPNSTLKIQLIDNNPRIVSQEGVNDEVDKNILCYEISAVSLDQPSRY